MTHVMGQGVVPDLLVSVDKLDLGWIRRWLFDYNDHKVASFCLLCTTLVDYDSGVGPI